MSSHKSHFLACVIAASFALPAFASAGSPKKSVVAGEAETRLPYQDTRLVLFDYDPNLTYALRTREGLYTHVELPPGETVMGFYLSDPTRWKYHVAGDKARLFVKPGAADLFTSATLVTSKRVYELTFTAGGDKAPWYQRVRWSVPGDMVTDPGSVGVFEPLGDEAPVAAFGTPSKQRAAMAGVPPVQAAGEPGTGQVDPAKINFNYKMEGASDIRPTSVFDDGKFTWIRLPETQQEMPAFFVIGDGGKPELVNYSTFQGFVVIHRLAKNFLLKLGEREAKIVAVQNCGWLSSCKD